ncbi:hypothetical protein JL2886_00041 [Phaeobacter gallaeciensis]|uniref:Uncharacterized protein n=1 Tax=Phaeobacter gallaeciensis TaxID=60890 RepID=A0A1B0ZLF4_9RHOB|nr:hypothetical protein JL2886_00041 [Phaeobacter gallaeciensis]
MAGMAFLRGLVDCTLGLAKSRAKAKRQNGETDTPQEKAPSDAEGASFANQAH